jgi:AcrR family transcriptional regulator
MSPAATIPADQAPRLVLDVADRLFYERGIAAVGMDDVRDESGVSLRRLYGLYPSKRDLVAAWLDDRHVRWMQWFTAAVERLTTDGTDPLVATFDALVEWAESPGYRGCAFLNAIAETTEIDASHRAIVAAHKRSLIDHLTTLALNRHATSAMSPALASDTSDHPAWLPKAIAVLIDGAFVQSAVFSSTHLLEHMS